MVSFDEGNAGNGTGDFVGAGWSYPIRTDATGSIALVRGGTELAESIRLILSTAPGERPMRPQFGCGIHDLVFAPANADTAGQIAHEVRVALRRWEPRIEVDEVRIGFAEAHLGKVHVDITYRVRDTSSPRNLVFPFYVIPASENAEHPN